MAGNHMSELSPRQRMINMMYLVLTALLALNVSKEVLDAFHKMDTSIGFSYSEKQEFNKKQYNDFELKALNNPQKLGQWNDVANAVQDESQKLIAVIDSIRFKIQEEAGLKEGTDELEALDDKEVTIKVLVKTKEDKGYGYGQLLKSARDQYREFLLSLDSLDLYSGQDHIYKLNILSLFNTKDHIVEGSNKEIPWEKNQYYGHVPVAAMAFMNQMKLDVGNMEGAVLELIQKKTGQSSITVNSQIGVVTAPRQTVMLGDSFHARVFIAGVDTNQLPTFNVYNYNSEGVRLDSTNVVSNLEVQGSQGIYAVKPTKQGTYWLGGDILVQSEEGEKRYEFKQQYRVDASMSVISPDKMNVLYTVVDNPVSVSVPGYSSDELSLHASSSQCKIKRIKNGTYQINIPQQRGKDRLKEIKLNVKANKKNVGKPIVFRVKNVPDPVPMIGRLVGYGELSKAELSNTWGITAKLKDFEFDLRYEVVSYTMSYFGSGGEQALKGTAGKWSTDMKSAFNGIKPGQQITFRDIKYKIAGVKGQKPQTMPGVITVKIK
jgi:gliding motility-associated protein GldM